MVEWGSGSLSGVSVTWCSCHWHRLWWPWPGSSKQRTPYTCFSGRYRDMIHLLNDCEGNMKVYSPKKNHISIGLCKFDFSGKTNFHISLTIIYLKFFVRPNNNLKEHTKYVELSGMFDIQCFFLILCKLEALIVGLLWLKVSNILDLIIFVYIVCSSRLFIPLE